MLTALRIREISGLVVGLACFICAIITVPASANEREQTVSIELLDQPPDQLAELLWTLRGEVSASPDLRAQDLAVRIDGEPRQDIDGMRDRVDEGMEAFESGDLKSARAELDDAALVLSGWPQHRADACTALVTLSRAAMSTGRLNAARSYLERLLRLDPRAGQRLDIPPSLRREMDRIDIAKPGKHSISVRVKQPGAVIYVNGVFMGRSDVTLYDLPTGKHHLRISLDGYRHWYGVFDSGRKKRVRVSLKRTARFGLYSSIRRRLSQGFKRGEMSTALPDYRAMASTDQALFFGYQDDAIVAVLYDLRRGSLIRRIAISPGGSATQMAREIIRRLYTGLDPRALNAPLSAMETVVVSKSSKPNWVLWTSVGLGVAAAIAIPTVILLSQSAESDQPAGITVRF